MRAARTLKKKMTEIAWATSSSFASMTGAVAAMAEPPQMEEPTPHQSRDLRRYFHGSVERISDNQRSSYSTYDYRKGLAAYL